MSTVIQNNAWFSLHGWQRVGRRVVTNQPTGAQWEYIYEGTKANLIPLADNLADKGARITLEIRAGKSSLVALWGFDPGETPEDGTSPSANGEQPVDRFELVWEPEQISIFSLPKVIAEAKTFAGISTVGSTNTTTTNSTGAAAYKYLLETAAKNGESNPLVPSGISNQQTYPMASYIWDNYLTKGVFHWEGARPVVRRIREYSQTYDLVTPQSQVVMTTPVYTRDALIREFQITGNFANRIPLDPTDDTRPDNEIYGWRFRSYSVGYDVGTRKVNETSEWDFASWSRGLYTIRT